MSQFARFTALVVLVASLGGCQRLRFVYEVPDGYVGWVNVSFGGPCPDDRRTFSGSVVKVGHNGLACSSVASEPRTMWVRAYYVDPQGNRLRELPSTGWGEGGLLWAPVGSLDGKSSRFFVGTEEQLNASWKATSGPSDLRP